MWQNSDSFVKSKIHWTFFCVQTIQGDRHNYFVGAGVDVIYSDVDLNNKYLFIFKLRQVIKNGNFSIVHSHFDYLSGFFFLATFHLDIKRVVHIHNTDRSIPVTNKYKHKILLYIFYLITIRLTHVFVGVSQFALNDYFLWKFPVPTRKIVIYNGVNVSEAEENLVHFSSILKDLGFSPGKTMLFIGRMEWIKNPIFAFEVFRELRSRRVVSNALFLGDGLEVERLKLLVEAYKMEDCIKLISFDHNKYKYYNAVDVVVFPRQISPKEAFGMVVLEAQVMSTPIVTSIGVLEELIIEKELVFRLDNVSNIDEWVLVVSGVIDLKNKNNQLDTRVNFIKDSVFDVRIVSQCYYNLYCDLQN